MVNEPRFPHTSVWKEDSFFYSRIQFIKLLDGKFFLHCDGTLRTKEVF